MHPCTDAPDATWRKTHFILRLGKCTFFFFGRTGNTGAKSMPKLRFRRRAAWAPLNAHVSAKRARWFQGHPNEGKAALSAAAAANQIAVRIHCTRTPYSLRGQLASRGALVEPPSPCAAGRCLWEATATVDPRSSIVDPGSSIDDR